MKKSIVISLIILFGFSSLCFGEIPDYWNNEIKVSYMGITILKIEMRLRDNFVLDSLLYLGEKDYKAFIPRVDFVGYLPDLKKIKVVYSIINKELYLSLTSVQKELELNKHIDKIVDITHRTMLVNEITKTDLIVSFWIDGVEVSTFENGKWSIK